MEPGELHMERSDTGLASMYIIHTYTHTHIHTSHSQRTGAYGGKRAIRFFRCKSCRNGKIHINFPEIRSFLIDFNGYTCIARALRAFIRASGSNSNLIYSCTSIRFEFISNTFYFQLKLKCCERLSKNRRLVLCFACNVQLALNWM